MTFIVIFLVIICGALSYLLILGMLRNAELIDQLEDIEELIGACAMRIDGCHVKLNEKSKLEVFFDDPVVKELVSDMKDARDALDEVSQALAQMTREDADETDADAKEEK